MCGVGVGVGEGELERQRTCADEHIANGRQRHVYVSVLLFNSM